MALGVTKVCVAASGPGVWDLEFVLGKVLFGREVMAVGKWGWRVGFGVVLALAFASIGFGLAGSGTEADPWRIRSLADFDEFADDANYWGDYTRLETDVNLAGRTYTTAVIAPGRYRPSILFTGVFDGNHHKVSGLTIDGGNNYYLGLFGHVHEGEIRDLGVEDGSISGTYHSIGGLAGYSRRGTISGCYFSGHVCGGGHVGGIVGRTEDVKMWNCYSTGDIIGESHIGGLVGLSTSNGHIWDCFSASDVNGVSEVGALVGEQYGGSTADGGIFNCFWDTEVQGNGVASGVGKNGSGMVADVNGLTTVEMQAASTFTSAGWDFFGESANGTSETWAIPGSGGYPVLSQFEMEVPFPLSGSGSVEDPFLISDANELGMISWYPENSCFAMGNDIDLAGIHWFAPVVPAFGGRFEGNGHKLINLRMSGHGPIGLFGILEESGQVRNLVLEGSLISEDDTLCVDDYAGSLVGINRGTVADCSSVMGVVSGDRTGGVGALIGMNCDYGSVSRCYSNGKAQGNFGCVGGIAGYNSGIVWNCTSSADANGLTCVGGLVGSNSNGSVVCSWSRGETSGSYSVGGLVGLNVEGRILTSYSRSSVIGHEDIGGLVGKTLGGRVSDCYATGDVNGVVSVGGVVGRTKNWSLTSGIIANCYSTGDVNGVEETGGIAGANYNGVILRCFWDTEVQTCDVNSGIGYSEGGASDHVLGLPTSEMQMESSFVSVGWDFLDERMNGTSEIWQIPSQGGYPLLSFFHGEPPFPLPGSGTEAEPYLIGDANELGMVKWYPKDCSFRLNSDIDLSNMDWSGAIIPVLGGCFYGDGYRIMNMGITGYEEVGFIGYLEERGRVTNLGIEGSSVSGTKRYIGGLAGVSSGTVADCYYSGSVIGDVYVGGVLGTNWGGTVFDCYSVGEVSGNGDVGGLVGHGGKSISNCWSVASVSGHSDIGGLVGGINGGIISDCWSAGYVVGTQWVGGLVGRNLADLLSCSSSSRITGVTRVGGLAGRNSGDISGCEFTGKVSGGSIVGGLSGINYGNLFGSYSGGEVESGGGKVGGLAGSNSEDYVISDCYSVGEVSGYMYVGGLVGENRGMLSDCYSAADVNGVRSIGGLVGHNYLGSVANCFWDADIQNHGTTDSVGLEGEGTVTNAVGLPTADMEMRTTYTLAGWDFVGESVNGVEDVWGICEGMNYPRLVWQVRAGDFVCPDGVGFEDFGELASYWGSSEGGDFELDGVEGIGFGDLIVFCGEWLAGRR